MSSAAKCTDHQIPCRFCDKVFTGKTASEAHAKAEAHRKTHSAAEQEAVFAKGDAAQPPTSMSVLDEGNLGRYIDGRCHLLAVEAEAGGHVGKLEGKGEELRDDVRDYAGPLFAAVSLQLPDRISDWLDDLGAIRQCIRVHDAKHQRDNTEMAWWLDLEAPNYQEQPLTRLRRARRRDLENRSREKAHVYGQFETALSLIRQLVIRLDYAMILAIEHNGKAPTTPITLPDAEALRQIVAEQEKMLRERGNLLRGKDRAAEFFVLRCPQCRAEHEYSPALKRCPAPSHAGAEGGKGGARAGGKRGRRTQRVCGAALKEEPQRRWQEWAEKNVQGMFPELVARHFGSRYVKGAIQAKDWTGGPYDAERLFSKPLTVTLHEVRNCLREGMGRDVDVIVAGLRKPVLLNGRRNLLPAGSTLAEKHADYLAVRDALQTCANGFKSDMAALPEFEDHYGPHTTVRGAAVPWHFAPAVELPMAVVGNEAGTPPPQTLECPSDLISLRVVRDEYRVSSSTMYRAIRAGSIKDYRTPEAARNARCMVSRAEVERFYPRCPQ